MPNAVWLAVVLSLIALVVVLGVLLQRSRRALDQEREFTDQLQRQCDAAEQRLAAAARSPRAEDLVEVREQAVHAVREALNGAMNELLALGNTAAQRIHDMIGEHSDPRVLRDLMPVDHSIAQMSRRVQNLLALAGSWPGQQRRTERLVDIVQGAQSRVHDYQRVKVLVSDHDVSVQARAVEGLKMAITEVLDNATKFSPPQAAVEVLFERNHHGLSVEVLDGGIKMPSDRLDWARRVLVAEQDPELTDLGNPPCLGLAVCAQQSRRHGFEVALDSGSPHGGMRATVFVPNELLTHPEPDDPPAGTSARPEPAEERPAEASVRTASGLPKRDRRRPPTSRTGEILPAPGTGTGEDPAVTQARHDQFVAITQNRE
ncbi:ATP-binding protein [Saccharopolyspora sp. CA-218241]|uniref:ATP-binding protein n=1 Tax=Saccharopolyspora sp. CA-218241 TaxID=3240027 RepID=UPI003D97CA86